MLRHSKCFSYENSELIISLQMYVWRISRLCGELVIILFYVICTFCIDRCQHKFLRFWKYVCFSRESCKRCKLKLRTFCKWEPVSNACRTHRCVYFSTHTYKLGVLVLMGVVTPNLRLHSGYDFFMESLFIYRNYL